MDFDSAKTKDFDKSSVLKSLSDEFELGSSSYVEGNNLDFHVSDALFSTINEDKVFNPGILVDKNSKVHEPNVLPTRSFEMMLDFDLENFQVEPKNDILNPKNSTSIILDPPPFTPFEESEMILEQEIEEFLKHDESLNMDLNDEKGDVIYLEKLLEVLNDDPFSQLIPSKFKKAIKNDNKLPVIILKDLKDDEKVKLIEVLKAHKSALAWKISDIKGIDPKFCTYKILMEDDYKPVVQIKRRVNPKIHEVIKKEVIKLLDAGLIYPISDSPWVSPVHCVPKKGGMTVVMNDDNELIPTRLVTGWRVCIDYRKLNDATRKDHFPLPFMDQMLERFYSFLDGFSGYFQILIDPQDQEKTTFTCPYGTFAYKRMPFGLCNAPGTFQRCMTAIFHDMIEKTMEVFMDDFSVFRDNFSKCLDNLDKMLNRCEETNLVLNWEKCHFMVKEGIVLGHKISKSGLEVDRAKVEVIAKLPYPTTVKGVRSFCISSCCSLIVLSLIPCLVSAVLVFQLGTLIPIMSWSSTLIAKISRWISNRGTLRGSNNCSFTVSSHVTNLLAVTTPHHTRRFVVHPALVAVWQNSSIPFPLNITPDSISSCYILTINVLPLKRLLLLSVVSRATLKHPFVFSILDSITFQLLIH
ncbi:reverse transcriptase domain-containing protein [Tanacetum coccineum]